VLEDASIELIPNQANYISLAWKVSRAFRGKERRSKEEKQSNFFGFIITIS